MAKVGQRGVKLDTTDNHNVVVQLKKTLTERQLGIVDFQFREIISYLRTMGLSVTDEKDKELLNAIRIKLMKEL